MIENLSPAIRFAEFTDDWEQRKLGDVVAVCSGRDYKHLDEGEIPVYGTGGYMLSVSEALSEEEDAIGIGRKGTIDNPYILRAPFWTVDTLFYCVPKENYDLDFVFSIYQNINWKAMDESTGVPSLSKGVINNVDVIVPLKEEQVKIGKCFSNFDNLITFYQYKYDKIVSLRASMLEKLFVQDGDSLPQIRFGEYKAPWRKVRLDEIVVPYSDPVETPHDGYERLGIRSHGKGVFHDYVEAGKELGTAQMHRVNSHNLIVNITFAWEHAIAITDDKDAGKLVSHRFPQFAMTDDIYDQFLKYMILDTRFRHHLLLSSPGGAGRNRVLKVPEMLEYEMMIPEVEEQRQIADYLNSLDELIDLYNVRVEKLKNIKKACLQKMFV